MRGVAKIMEATIGLILVLTVLLYLKPITYEQEPWPQFNFTLQCDPSCMQKALNEIVAKRYIVGVEPYYYKRICMVNNKSYIVNYSLVQFNIPSWAKDCNTTSFSLLNGYTIKFRNNVSSGTLVAKVSLPLNDIVAFDENGELRVGKDGLDFLIELPDFEKNETKIVYVFEGKSRYYTFPESYQVEYEIQPSQAKRVNTTIYVNLTPGESKCVIVECGPKAYSHQNVAYDRIPYETTDSVIIGNLADEVSGTSCKYEEETILDGVNWILYRIKVCKI